MVIRVGMVVSVGVGLDVGVGVQVCACVLVASCEMCLSLYARACKSVSESRSGGEDEWVGVLVWGVGRCA